MVSPEFQGGRAATNAVKRLEARGWRLETLNLIMNVKE